MSSTPANLLPLSKGATKALPGDFKLLLGEVTQYLDQVRTYLTGHSGGTNSIHGKGNIDDLRHKLAYISTLALKTRNQNFDMERGGAEETDCRHYHGLASVAMMLFRIAELALNVVRQCRHLSRIDFMDSYDLDEFFDSIDQGLTLIRPALEQRRIKLVIRLCRVEEKLDAHYAGRVAQLIQELEEGCGSPGDRATGLMIVHYLERIGDSLLEIGEEILHIFLGENLNFSQYQAVSTIVKEVWGCSDQDLMDTEGFFHSIWSGRSGCRVGIVSPQGGGALNPKVGEAREQIIFKHGPIAKLERERGNLELWGQLWPGLPPMVKDLVPTENKQEATLILEYIPGVTLKSKFQNPQVKDSLDNLIRVLHLMGAIWQETRLEEKCSAAFAQQAQKRLGPVRSLYPELVDFQGVFGGLEIKPLAGLLQEAARLEKKLMAPFTVRIHGDFNLSNIMLEEREGRYRLIDFYRSRLSDYAQDLAVMIMSILRLSLREHSERQRLSHAAQQVFTFAKGFATSQNDPTLEARLAFGLARSYLTSARFEPRRSVATRFIGYSRHLWEKLIIHGHKGQPWSDFKLASKVLYI